MTKDITIYTKDYCPYCRRAKALFDALGVEYIEYEISDDPARAEDMRQRSNGGWTVPQIFIGDVHVGGSDDLHDLHARGALAALLGEAKAA